MADLDTAFVQQILNIPKRKWKPHIHHNCQADDFGRRLEVAKWGAVCHQATLGPPLPTSTSFLLTVPEKGLLTAM